MWRDVTSSEHERYLKLSITFTGDAELYGSWMLKVLDAWPVSCEHNLTDTNQNRRAWIGHAACCLAIKCPEHITREAWGQLTQDQQNKANYQADLAVWEFEDRHETKNCGIHQQMVIPGLFGRNTRRSAFATGRVGACSVLPTYLQGDNEERCCAGNTGVFAQAVCIV